MSTVWSEWWNLFLENHLHWDSLASIIDSIAILQKWEIAFHHFLLNHPMSNLTTRDPSSDSPNIIDAAWSFFSGRACSLARFAPYMSLKVSKI